MKYLFIISVIFLISCDGMYKQEEGTLYEYQKVAMPEHYRKITGYDSIQVIYYKPGSPLGKGWEGSFCNPNKLGEIEVVLVNDTLAVRRFSRK